MRTDFYLLSTPSLEERDDFACRLVEKAFLAQQSVYVATESAEHAAAFDQRLWQFRPDSFVPHEVQQQPHPNTWMPVLIGDAQTHQATGIWVHLSTQPPPAPLACQRLIEIIPKIPNLQALARERFRRYRELGYTLQTHPIN